jgi:hypothetical protein
LTISDADADDHGTYTCEATKDGKVGEDTFDLEVVMPAVCEHEDGTNWEEGTIYNPQDVSNNVRSRNNDHISLVVIFY